MTPSTVGRIVHYWATEDFGQQGQPLAAIITHVWSDTIVNLSVFHPSGGTPQSRISVQKRDPFESLPSGARWDWAEVVEP